VTRLIENKIAKKKKKKKKFVSYPVVRRDRVQLGANIGEVLVDELLREAKARTVPSRRQSPRALFGPDINLDAEKLRASLFQDLLLLFVADLGAAAARPRGDCACGQRGGKNGGWQAESRSDEWAMAWRPRRGGPWT